MDHTSHLFIEQRAHDTPTTKDALVAKGCPIGVRRPGRFNCGPPDGEAVGGAWFGCGSEPSVLGGPRGGPGARVV